MKLLLTLTLVVMLALAAVAVAAEIEGTVKSVDAQDRSFVLEDGTKIWVAEGVAMEQVKEGAKVKASYEQRDGKNVATTITVE